MAEQIDSVQTPGSSPTFLDALVKLIVGLVAVALLEKLALSFPLSRDAGAVLLLPVSDWIRLIAVTGQIAFFWLFTRDAARLLRASYPAIPDFAHMMTYLGVFVAVALGYGAYMPLVAAVLSEALSGYQIIGVLGAVVPLVALVITFFRRLNLVAMAVSQAVRRLFSLYPVVKCGGCGEVVPADQNFCSRCGTALSGRQVS